MKLRCWSELSKREVEVLRLLAEGFSNKEIAKELNLAVSTIANYTNSLYTRLSVDNRVRAIIVGRERGWIE